MKQRRLLALLLVLVVTASVLSGCGASSSYKDAVVEEAAPMEPMAAAPMKDTANGMVMSASGASTEAVQQTGQKLIRKVNIDAETEDLEALLGNLTAQITALDGYIESQELYNGSSYSSYRHRSANLTVRIPADRLDSFVVQLKDASNVVSYN